MDVLILSAPYGHVSNSIIFRLSRLKRSLKMQVLSFFSSLTTTMQFFTFLNFSLELREIKSKIVTNAFSGERKTVCEKSRKLKDRNKAHKFFRRFLKIDL